MSQSFTNLLYHFVFSTKGGQPLITLEYQPRLYDLFLQFPNSKFAMAPGVGVEPTSSDSKSDVLPVALSRKKWHRLQSVS